MIVERACWRAMTRAGTREDVKGRVRKVIACARATDTVVEERMDWTVDMLEMVWCGEVTEV
jgi:hypothetical protein